MIQDTFADQIIKLECNLDDMSPEEIAYAQEKILAAGALDVYTIPIGMKKSRPGTLFCVLCKTEDKREMGKLIFTYTSTIGIREQLCERMILKRQEEYCQTQYGRVAIKKSYGYGVEKIKIEYEDLKRIAENTGKSIASIRNDILKEI